jgi:hypothetical protein
MQRQEAQAQTLIGDKNRYVSRMDSKSAVVNLPLGKAARPTIAITTAAALE